MYHVDVQRFTASNRLILTVFAGKYVSLLGETNKLRHRSSLKALPRVSPLSRELTRGRYDHCCCSTFATHFLGQGCKFEILVSLRVLRKNHQSF